MDFGDIIQVIIYGIIGISVLSGFFGRSGDDKKPARTKPARPTELRESGGQERPTVRLPLGDPADAAPVFTGEGVSRTEARRAELLERFGGEMDARRREERRREPLEHDVSDTERVLLEHDISDMPTIAEELDPEHHPRRKRAQEVRRRRRIVEGGDVLRRSLKDPATLERAFIVKEVLDRPVGMRDGR